MHFSFIEYSSRELVIYIVSQEEIPLRSLPGSPRALSPKGRDRGETGREERIFTVLTGKLKRRTSLLSLRLRSRSVLQRASRFRSHK
jgi:hypothetical protein